MNGYLNVLKPPGMSSAAVVGRVKRLTGEKRVGHAGTLDPEAAGVLPVMVGRATRLFDYLVDKQKIYVAEVAFGQATDTQDATGTVTSAGEAWPDRAAVEAAAERLTGDILQRPSAYSAIKRDGEPLYRRARRGEEVEVPERLVHVERILVGRETPRHGFMLRVECGKGTYIRSICQDLGELVGCPAHMRFLLRCRSGAFGLDTAVTLEEAETLAQAGGLADRLLPPDWPLGHLPRYDVPAGLTKQAANGVALPLTADLPAGPVRVYAQGRFCGIAAREGTCLAWHMVIPPGAD